MKLEQDIQDKKQSLSDLEEAFHKIEDTLESKATVAIVAWLMTKPENAGGREEVFSVMLALLEGFDTYTKANRTSIRHFQKISKLIEELKKMIADELWDK